MVGVVDKVTAFNHKVPGSIPGTFGHICHLLFRHADPALHPYEIG